MAGPAPFTPAEARAFALALTYATAALAYAAERYPDFRAWCLTQPSSPDPRQDRMEEYQVLLGEAAGLAWQHTDVKAPREAVMTSNPVGEGIGPGPFMRQAPYINFGGGLHEHREHGQVLKHRHARGGQPHGYYEHPEDIPRDG